MVIKGLRTESSFIGSDHTALDAFNNSVTNEDRWQTGSGNGAADYGQNEWIKFDVGNNRNYIECYRIWARAGTNSNEALDRARSLPRDWRIEGSDDDVNWTILDTRTGIDNDDIAHTINGISTAPYKEYKMQNPGTYRYYRLWVVSTNSINGIIISELAYYGRSQATSSNSYFEQEKTGYPADAGGINFWHYTGNNTPATFKCIADADGTCTIVYGCLSGWQSNDSVKVYVNGSLHSQTTLTSATTTRSVSTGDVIEIQEMQAVMGLYSITFVRHSIMPVLTSASQDGYIVTSSSTHSSGANYKAFNKSYAPASDDYWMAEPYTHGKYDGGGNYNGINSLGGVSGEWIALQIPTARIMISVHITARDLLIDSNGTWDERDKAPKDFKVLGSNDGTNWNEVLSVTGANIQDITNGGGSSFYADTTDVAYNRFALVVQAVNGGVHLAISEISYSYSRSHAIVGGSAGISNVVSWLGGDSTISKENAHNGSMIGYGSTNSTWGEDIISGNPSLGFELNESVTLTAYRIWPLAGKRIGSEVGGTFFREQTAPRDWTIQGSNDNSSWTIIDTRADETFSVGLTDSEAQSAFGNDILLDAETDALQYSNLYNIRNPGSYKYYKIKITDTSNRTFDNWTFITEMAYYLT